MPEGSARAPRGTGVDPEVLRTRPDANGRLTDEARAALKSLEGPSGRSGRLSPLSYNLTISHAHRFVWFRVAKVGTRTVFDHLRGHGVPLDVASGRRMRYPTALMDDYCKFAFVRDPRARFLSAWTDKVLHTNYFGFDDATHARMRDVGAFLDWTAGHDLADLGTTDQHLALQTRLVDLSQVDVLGRLETFAADWAEVCARVGIPAPEGRAVNSTGGGRRPVDPGLASAIAEVYRRDVQILGYADRG